MRGSSIQTLQRQRNLPLRQIRLVHIQSQSQNRNEAEEKSKHCNPPVPSISVSGDEDFAERTWSPVVHGLQQVYDSRAKETKVGDVGGCLVEDMITKTYGHNVIE